MLSSLSQWRVKISGEKECIQCHLCADACPFGAIEPPVAPSPPSERKQGRRELTTLLVLLPLFIFVGAGVLRLSSPVLARMDPAVRLADRLSLEEQELVEGQTEASEAFDIQGRPTIEAYERSVQIQAAFNRGSWWLGAWIGLVFWARMLGLSIRRHHDDYQANAYNCVACTRCFDTCPLQHERAATEEIPSAETSAEETQ